MEQNLNLKGIPDYYREKAFGADDKSFCYQGIWICSGPQGSGKTLLAMHMLKQMYDEFPEVLIVSNINIFGLPCIPYRGIEDFDKYNNGQKGIIFFIDEIHTLFNSLESKNMPVSTMTVWSQNRKNRRVILGTSQRFTRVAKGLREQCTYNYECKSRILPFYRYRVIEGDQYDDNGKLDPEYEKTLRWSWYVPKVNVMRMYNTYEIVTNEGVGK